MSQKISGRQQRASNKHNNPLQDALKQAGSLRGNVHVGLHNSNDRTVPIVGVGTFQDPGVTLAQGITDALDPVRVPGKVRALTPEEKAEIRPDAPSERVAKERRKKLLRKRVFALCPLATQHSCQRCKMCNNSLHRMACPMPEKKGHRPSPRCLDCDFTYFSRGRSAAAATNTARWAENAYANPYKFKK